MYRPPSPVEATLAQVHAPAKVAAKTKIGLPTSRGGLFLTSKKGGGFQILFKLPQFEFQGSVDGQIQLQTNLGLRPFVSENFRTKMFIPLAPNAPLADVGGWGALSQVADSIRDVLSQFKSMGNFFGAVEDGGKLISPGEPLELGERYLHFGMAPLPPPPNGSGARVSSSTQECDWHLYEFQLPSDASNSNSEVIASIERWLGKPVRASTARLWAVDPPPHHIDPDGTLVYPLGTAPIRLRRSRECETRIVVHGQASGGEAIYWLTSGDGELRNLSTGDVSIVVSDRIRVQLRFDECELFNPEGIRIETSQGAFELFAQSARDTVTKIDHLLITCPSEQVAQFVAAASHHWRQVANTLAYDGPDRSQAVLDGGNFGDMPRSTASDPQSIMAPSLTSIWLDGVSKRIAGRAFSQAELGLAGGLTSRTPIGVLCATSEWIRVHRAYTKLDK